MIPLSVVKSCCLLLSSVSLCHSLSCLLLFFRKSLSFIVSVKLLLQHDFFFDKKVQRLSAVVFAFYVMLVFKERTVSVCVLPISLIKSQPFPCYSNVYYVECWSAWVILCNKICMSLDCASGDNTTSSSWQEIQNEEAKSQTKSCCIILSQNRRQEQQQHVIRIQHDFSTTKSIVILQRNDAKKDVILSFVFMHSSWSSRMILSLEKRLHDTPLSSLR